MEPAALGKIPPQSLEAEAAVLGGILLDNSALDRVVELIGPDDFYRETHRKIFRAILELWDRREPIDLLTLTEALKTRGELAEVGGAAYVSELPDQAVTAGNIQYHARILREKALLRRLIGAASEIVSKGFEARGEVNELVDQAEQAIFQIAERRTKQSFVKVGSLIRDTFLKIEDLYRRKEMVTGVPTGFTEIDRMTAGLQPSDLIIVAGRPSMGKCLAAGSEIVLSDGAVRTIEEIFTAREAELLTLDESLKLTTAKPSAFVDDGVKPVFRVTTGSGRSIETTITHPFLTIEGWKPLSEIRPGDHVAVPRRLPIFGTHSIGQERAKILGYLLGDGSLTSTCPLFTNNEPRLQEDFRLAVEAFGGLSVERCESADRAATVRVSTNGERLAENRLDFARRLRTALKSSGRSARAVAKELGVSPAAITVWSQGLAAPSAARFRGLAVALAIDELDLAPSVAAIRRSAPNALRRWLAELDLWGKGASEKFVPGMVFTLVRDEVATFLNRLFATDGWGALLSSGQAQLGFASASPRLAAQVQHLLLRFGVISSLRARRVKYKEERRAAWQLNITDARSILRFIDQIGVFGKEGVLERIKEALGKRRYQTNRDLVPVQVWDEINAARAGVPWSRLAHGLELAAHFNLHVGRRAVSRGRLLKIAEILCSPRLRNLAESDVYWDEVRSIEPLGEKQVYDLTVPDTHNFVANDVCVHNTSFCLNIAEHAAITKGIGVAVFSLEMSKEQLVLRLFCSQAGVDLNKIRTGFLAAKDFPKLATAAGRIEEAPIYIDDTPAISSLELRAKARRLARDKEAKLGLIIVDYLQLMRGSGGTDSREQEISEISRSLKALAKELNMPIIALSQLNRQVENRTPPKPRMADLRECVAGATLVLLSDGRRVPVRDLVGTTPDVLALSAAGKIVSARSEAVWSVGTRPVFDVVLASGQRIRATSQHRLLGADGWVRIAELHAGDRLATARALPKAVVAEHARLSEGPELAREAESDLFWDRVVRIDPAGEEEVFDLTVPGPASWLADGIVSHNSGAIEQDADVILFIFREEVYDQQTSKKGQAEIIIGKQRNGPIGEVTLAFLESFTRFENFEQTFDDTSAES